MQWWLEYTNRRVVLFYTDSLTITDLLRTAAIIAAQQIVFCNIILNPIPLRVVSTEVLSIHVHMHSIYRELAQWGWAKMVGLWVMRVSDSFSMPPIAKHEMHMSSKGTRQSGSRVYVYSAVYQCKGVQLPSRGRWSQKLWTERKDNTCPLIRTPKLDSKSTWH